MKKIILTILLFISFTNILNASCTYKEKREINTLASYVNYDYNYENNRFNVTIYNLKDNLVVNYNGALSKTNDESIIENIKEGASLKINILAGEGTCEGETLRTITINIPYVNPYYNSDECKGRNDLTVCTSRFLDYKISESTFNSLINKRVVSEDIIEEKVEEVEKTFVDKVMELFEQIYIPVILVIISSTITYIVLKPIYRKIKHGL